MEYASKGSLYQLIHDQKQQQPLDWSLRKRLALDIGYGLNYLHSQEVTYYGLYSWNVLLNDQMQAKLCDFGLSEVKSEANYLTPNRDVMKHVEGHAWEAPELFQDSDSDDETSEKKVAHSKQADMYSYGMVLWELASRKIPFKNMNPMNIPSQVLKGKREKIPEDCPKTFAELIQLCWSGDPKLRPTAQNVIDQLESSNDSDNNVNNSPHVI